MSFNLSYAGAANPVPRGHNCPVKVYSIDPVVKSYLGYIWFTVGGCHNGGCGTSEPEKFILNLLPGFCSIISNVAI